MTEVKRKTVSPKGRVSYPHVFRPQVQKDDQTGAEKKNYTVTLLFDKDDPGLAELKAAASAAEKETFPKGRPAGFRSPFRDGDTDRPDDPAYRGKIYISFRSPENRKPAVVGPTVQPLDESEFYPGCYAKVSYSCYAYDKKMNKGVAFGLGNVQKVADGERLDGRRTAEEEFESIEQPDANLF